MEELTRTMGSDQDRAIPWPDLHKLKTAGRTTNMGEDVWSTIDSWGEGPTGRGEEEISSVAHVVGLLVAHTSATEARKSECLSRSDMAFSGWDKQLEPPCGRPACWHTRPTPHPKSTSGSSQDPFGEQPQVAVHANLAGPSHPDGEDESTWTRL